MTYKQIYKSIIGKAVESIDTSCDNQIIIHFTDSSAVRLETVNIGYGLSGIEPTKLAPEAKVNFVPPTKLKSIDLPLFAAKGLRQFATEFAVLLRDDSFNLNDAEQDLRKLIAYIKRNVKVPKP